MNESIDCFKTLITPLSRTMSIECIECIVMENDKWPCNQNAGGEQELVDTLRSLGRRFGLMNCDQGTNYNIYIYNVYLDRAGDHRRIDNS